MIEDATFYGLTKCMVREGLLNIDVISRAMRILLYFSFFPSHMENVFCTLDYQIVVAVVVLASFLPF